MKHETMVYATLARRQLKHCIQFEEQTLRKEELEGGRNKATRTITLLRKHNSRRIIEGSGLAPFRKEA